MRSTFFRHRLQPSHLDCSLARLRVVDDCLQQDVTSNIDDEDNGVVEVLFKKRTTDCCNGIRINHVTELQIDGTIRFQPRDDEDGDENIHNHNHSPAFDLPPIVVERLQKLKNMQLWFCWCRSIPKELDNLPFLEKQFTSRGTLPEYSRGNATYWP